MTGRAQEGAARRYEDGSGVREAAVRHGSPGAATRSPSCLQARFTRELGPYGIMRRSATPNGAPPRPAVAPGGPDRRRTATGSRGGRDRSVGDRRPEHGSMAPAPRPPPRGGAPWPDTWFCTKFCTNPVFVDVVR
ncbi:hypothetical protein ACFVT5_20525 [Streptomyces sp. NPDC058001]|uniref:hypothetical protein n=1 Tax=Streptomyces sp. NPDC058001 TaxID=3346300 RepID=UPI0036EF01AF